jgi:flavin-dependent dehydrogenase
MERGKWSPAPPLISWKVLTLYQSRAEFDDLLLKHAEECGVEVFEETTVTGVKFQDDDIKKRPISLDYEDKSGNEAATGTITFDYLVDASGRNGVMSLKYLKNRKNNQSLKNIAIWGYWKECSRYAAGTNRDNAVYIEALHGQSKSDCYTNVITNPDQFLKR